MLKNNNIEFVFNDEYILIVNKPPKIIVQPSPDNKINLTTILKEKLKENLFPCHRLDKETSGLLTYAKTRKVVSFLTKQFKERKIEKRYYALVKGTPKRKKGIIESYVIDKEGRHFKEKPKKATTFYRLIKKFSHFSLLELIPLTGRTHQLRIQLAQIGHPILGEKKYAYKRDFSINFKRLALHAYFLKFTHPISKEKVTVSVDLAKDIKEFIEKKGG